MSKVARHAELDVEEIFDGSGEAVHLIATESLVSWAACSVVRVTLLLNLVSERPVAVLDSIPDFLTEVLKHVVGLSGKCRVSFSLIAFLSLQDVIKVLPCVFAKFSFAQFRPISHIIKHPLAILSSCYVSL